MKKPTKKELREIGCRELLSRYAYHIGQETRYHEAFNLLPSQYDSQVKRARDEQTAIASLYGEEILRRMGGAK